MIKFQVNGLTEKGSKMMITNNICDNFNLSRALDTKH